MRKQIRIVLAVGILGCCAVTACRPAKPLALAEVLEATRYLPGHPTVIETELRRQEVEAWMMAREGRAVCGQMIVRAVYPPRAQEATLVTGLCGPREFDPNVRAMFDQTEAAGLAKVGRGWTLTVQGKLSMGSAHWGNTIVLTDCRLVGASPPKPTRKAGP